jgi:hypothetical protein
MATRNDSYIDDHNIKESLKRPSIESRPSTLEPELFNSPGYRAAEAYIRPSPYYTWGKLLQSGFDLRNCVFTFTLVADSPTPEDKPTEIFLPEWHFPKDKCTVEVSGGKWTIAKFDEDAGLIQKLKWWHMEGEQWIKVTGVPSRLQQHVAESTGEPGYLEQYRDSVSRCTMM